MKVDFEPNGSFCYRFARYVLLDEIAKQPEVVGGQPFKMIHILNRLLPEQLTAQQLASTYPKKNDSSQLVTIEKAIKFFVGLRAKRGNESPFVWLGDGNMFRLKSDADAEADLENDQLEAEDDSDDPEIAESDGWIYAFSFPMLVKSGPFPIKIGKTANDVASRILFQCRSSAVFEQPVVLGKWQVKRFGVTELAIHNVLKARGKWRENAPGVEWFDTTVAEVETILNFVQENH